MKLFILFALVLATVSADKLHDGRIINGILAQRGQFPYQVGLSLRKGGSFWCGGSLISPEWILTAAHCTYGVTNGIAYLGSTEIERAVYTVPFTHRNIIVHEQYGERRIRNDIALIRIPRVTLGNGVSTIQMASGPEQYDNTVATAVGWGRTSDYSSVSPNLYYANLNVRPVSACSRYYGNLSPSLVCVSTESGSSTCQGDSGGPLVVHNTLIGLTSFGSAQGCQAGYPVVFTRVSSYRSWIRSHTGI